MVAFHVDLDAFFASVEQLDHPEYRGKPLIVGAQPGHRGVVSTCSYEARAFGIHSAMPISEAYSRCPEAVFVSPRINRYQEFSERVMSILSGFTPELIQISCDEAFLDMSGMEKLLGSPTNAARKIKERILAETGLRISIGSGSSRFIAKLASARSKPDGLLVIEEGDEERFVQSLPLSKLWGVGDKTRTRLESFGIRTIKELAGQSESRLSRLMGEGACKFLLAVSRGIDPGIFGEESKSRSLSAEYTFDHDLGNREAIEQVFLELSHTVMFRAMRENVAGTVAFIKLRFPDFTTTTAQSSLDRRVESAEELYRLALKLLDTRWDGIVELRLIGLGISGVHAAETPSQLELFSGAYEKHRKVELAVLKLKEAGKGRITKARLLGRETRPDEEPGREEGK